MPLKRSLALPETATAPFCPSEVKGTMEVASGLPTWKKFLRYLGPGILVSVGYMDPGNWATDIEAGSRFGYNLLFIVLFSSLAAILLQCLSLRLGIVTGKDLAQVCRQQYSKKSNFCLWILAEIGIIACDLAEVLGGALAFHLLFGCSLAVGVALTALDTLIVLGLKGKGFRQLEAIVLGLVLTIGVCFLMELVWLKPDWTMVAQGFVPSAGKMGTLSAWYIAIGILGATVMPHNLFLHSSIVQTRSSGQGVLAQRKAIAFSTIDTVLSLFAAFFINAAILIMAAAAFHATGKTEVADIQDAYKLLEPILGHHWGSILFAIALLASGQSSTFTGTIAGQVVLEGFMDLKIPCWKRRLMTRALALIPAFVGVLLLGEDSTGRLLVLSQVILSLQLPFAMYPLIRFTGQKKLMGPFANGLWQASGAWALFILISAANLWLLYQSVI